MLYSLDFGWGEQPIYLQFLFRDDDRDKKNCNKSVIYIYHRYQGLLGRRKH